MSNKKSPINIYAISLNLLCNMAGDENYLSFVSIASYVKYMGYTHVLLLNTESSSLFKEMYLKLLDCFVEAMHEQGICVIYELSEEDLTDEHLIIRLKEISIGEGKTDGVYFNRPLLDNVSKKSLRNLNDKIHSEFPQLISVTGSCFNEFTDKYAFDLIIDMSAYDTALDYLTEDPIFRRFKQNSFDTTVLLPNIGNRILPLAPISQTYQSKTAIHDIFGNREDKLRQLRALNLLFYTLPGITLTPMGAEFASPYALNSDLSLLDNTQNQDFRSYMRELNYFYLKEAVLWDRNEQNSLSFYDGYDKNKNVIAFKRRSEGKEIAVIINFSGIAQIIELAEDGIFECAFSSEPSNKELNIENKGNGFYSVTLPEFFGTVIKIKNII